MDLIPSLAFTALLELHPTYARMDVRDEVATDLMRELTQTMRAALAQGHPDLWAVASDWIGGKVTVSA